LILAGGIALAALDRVSPVGVLGVGDRTLQVQPSLSKAQVMQWMLSLSSFRYDEGTTLSERLGQLMPSLKSRVLLLVLSDLHDPGAVSSLKRAAQLHDCAVLQLQDPAEEQVRGAGFLRVSEAESGHQFTTHGRRSHLDQEALEWDLRRAGIDHHLVRCGESYLPGVRQFFSSRGLLGKAAR
jgi:uncharacterized protein (DUF58 family)